RPVRSRQHRHHGDHDHALQRMLPTDVRSRSLQLLETPHDLAKSDPSLVRHASPSVRHAPPTTRRRLPEDDLPTYQLQRKSLQVASPPQSARWPWVPGEVDALFIFDEDRGPSLIRRAAAEDK